MSLPNCDKADDEYLAEQLCPGRSRGVHDVCCANWTKWFDEKHADRLLRPADPTEGAVPGLLPYDAASAYEVTLTSTKDDPKELRDYLKKIVESKMYSVKAWEACIELQENGNPHIHAVIYSDKKYCDGTKVKSRIKFPYRYKFARVRSIENYLKYIHKENDNLVIQEYCERHAIPQFFNGL